ncbi:MAG TPA: sulfite exporter TauE/SafE family protein [Acidimicrobiales bacterium]|nr:sulfite exporter TauE/SafE family protein [Acidimicrobiales bacterium]
MHALALLTAATSPHHYAHPSSALLAVAGLVTGVLVGITGMGGGALMTPTLVLLFNVNPTVAIASDLVSSLFIKPVGGGVHIRYRTVRWPLVGWLAAGSVPAALGGAFLLNHLGSPRSVGSEVKTILGWALLVACLSLLAKIVLTIRTNRRRQQSGEASNDSPYLVKAGPTVLVGLVGGFMVGMTSVGSGSLMMILLMLLYPRLSARSLVGTDLVQSVPVVAAAALGQVLWGHVDFGIAGALLAGSIPGVLVGARVSALAPDKIVRPLLVFILMTSGLALLLANDATGLVYALGIVVVTGLPLWAAVDAVLLRWDSWRAAGLSRTSWVTLLGVGAPLGLGLLAAVVYVVRVRPRVAGTLGEHPEPALAP